MNKLLIAGVLSALAAMTVAPHTAHAVEGTGNPTVANGLDTCDAPSLEQMNGFQASTNRTIGAYIGGANRACGNAQLSTTWVNTMKQRGWQIMPIYVGVQAPCTTLADVSTMSPDSNVSYAQGQASANDAIAGARAIGIQNGVIFDDMEAYAPSDCSPAVMSFLAGWNSKLHSGGYQSGVYGSMHSVVADLVRVASARPDTIWFARYDGAWTTQDPAIPGDLWVHHRIKQFANGHPESSGGVTLNVDDDAVDVPAAPVAPPPPAPAPPPPPPANTTVPWTRLNPDGPHSGGDTYPGAPVAVGPPNPNGPQVP